MSSSYQPGTDPSDPNAMSPEQQANLAAAAQNFPDEMEKLAQAILAGGNGALQEAILRIANGEDPANVFCN